jgi:rhamnosyltransferase
VRGKTVGIVGARGIDNYGGYERMLVDLVPRLVKKGYSVRCTCERPEGGDCPNDYMGAALDYFPLKAPTNYTLRKLFELFYDSFFIAKYSLVCDIIYVLGIYGGASLLIPRLFGKKVIVNTDGLEWKRAKYHIVERSLIVLFFAVSLNLASKIVIDNEQLRQCIGTRHNPKICYIPYGVSRQESHSWDQAKLHSYLAEQTDGAKIEKGKYWLLVSRLEPENNIYEIVDGFVKARPKYPLVVVGDFTSNKYRDRVYGQAFNGNSSDIAFLGSIYDADVLWMLRQHCLAYIHGHSVGGTNPSLLEAMISENLIVAHDNIFNKEVCGTFAHYFSNSSDLSDIVTSIEESMGDFADVCSDVHKRAIAAYSWDRVTTLYDKLFRGDHKQEAGAYRETQAHVGQQSGP